MPKSPPNAITNPGHPFRRALPARPVPRIGDEDSDLKLFALSFTAFFVCFYTFLI